MTGPYIVAPSLSRAGLVCRCGRFVAEHFTARNGFLSCRELAEREDAASAAASCTTARAAEAAVRSMSAQEGC